MKPYEDVTEIFPALSMRSILLAGLHSALGCLSPAQFEDHHARQTVKTACLILSSSRGALHSEDGFERSKASCPRLAGRRCRPLWTRPGLRLLRFRRLHCRTF